MPSGEDFDWDDLRYFLRAVQSKTLAGAARAMGVEHTTVGRRLSALERSFGAALVLRSAEGLKLTPLAERILPLVEDVERSVRVVREAVDSRMLRVRLAVPSGFAKFFSECLPRLREEHPEIALELISGSRPVDLGKGEADLALRGGPVDDVELIVRKLCESGWSLYASESYLARHPTPIDVRDLSGHELIGYDESLAAVPAAQWVEGHAATAAIVLRSREMTDMLAAAVSGVGLGLLPCALGDEEPLLRRVTPEVLATRSVSLVYRREATLSKPVCAVIQFVLDVVRGAAGRISGAVAPEPRVTGAP